MRFIAWDSKMMNEKSNSYLVRLEGQKIVNITTDLASMFALKATKNEIAEERTILSKGSPSLLII